MKYRWLNTIYCHSITNMHNNVVYFQMFIIEQYCLITLHTLYVTKKIAGYSLYFIISYCILILPSKRMLCSIQSEVRDIQTQYIRLQTIKTVSFLGVQKVIFKEKNCNAIICVRG